MVILCVAFDTLRSFIWLEVLELDVPIAPTVVGDKPAGCFLAFEFVGIGTAFRKFFAKCKLHERKYGLRVAPCRALRSNYGLEILWA